jgi:hypothetical protein
MTLSQLETMCRELRRKCGDLEIVGGYLADDRGPTKILALDRDGVDVDDSGKLAMEAFIS